MSLFGNIIPWFKRGPALNRQTVAMERVALHQLLHRHRLTVERRTAFEPGNYV